ncbi:MAG: hypothetical protein ACYDBY_02925 [Thermoanaerobaculia bacterium]
MRRVTSFSALGLALSLAILAATSAFGQETTTSPSGKTEVAPDGATRTTTKTTTVEGKVLRYEPGKTIVVMESDDRETTYVLAPNATIPADIEVGRYVSLSTVNSKSGPMTVTKVTTRSLTPAGNIKTETKTHGTTPSGDQVSATTTTVTGTVNAVQTGRSATLVLPDKSAVAYVLDAASVVPADLSIGSTVTVVTTTTTTGAPIVVKTITVAGNKTTRKTTTVKKYEPTPAVQLG